ncbi:MAG: hypothetical protein J4F35_10835 [Candidatus Latescibacteria bacterium]|nr:hypothetical protein [Candidatus Latescibacterota bacterium]
MPFPAFLGNGRLELRGKFVALLWHEVATGHDLGVFYILGPLGVPIANASTADDSYSVHGASF